MSHIRIPVHSDLQSSSTQPQPTSIICPKLLPPKRRIFEKMLGINVSLNFLSTRADDSYLNNCPSLNQMMHFLNYNRIEH